MKDKLNKYFILLIFCIFSWMPSIAFPHQGCCSWHSGVDQCDIDSGRLLCNDGTLSPTCQCDDEGDDGSSNYIENDDGDDGTTD